MHERQNRDKIVLTQTWGVGVDSGEGIAFTKTVRRRVPAVFI